jgi:hypothetical protein
MIMWFMDNSRLSGDHDRHLLSLDAILTSSSPFAIVVVLDIWQTRTLYPYFGKYQDFRVSLRYGWCFSLRFRSMSSSPSKSRLFTRS